MWIIPQAPSFITVFVIFLRWTSYKRELPNVWFPITRSSIYIPTQVTNLIPDSTFELIKCAYSSAGATADSILAVLLSKTASDLNVEVEKLTVCY